MKKKLNMQGLWNHITSDVNESALGLNPHQQRNSRHTGTVVEAKRKRGKRRLSLQFPIKVPQGRHGTSNQGKPPEALYTL